MKRIDRFRAMSAEELAEMLEYKACRWCSYYDEPNDKCSINIVTRNLSHCRVGITEGLNQDDNPIPEIEVGDLIDANSWRYVAIGNDIVVNPSGMGKFCLSSMKDIKTIWRYKVNRYEAIWRADK